MKWKNPKGKEFGTVGATVGGMIIGAMVSDAVVSLIHKPKATAGTAEAKKEDNMLMVKRSAVAIGAGYAGAGIDGNDTTSVFVKGVCNGAATKQVLGVINQLAAKNDKLADTSTPVKKAIATALGLACPGDAPAQLMGAKRRKTGMKGMSVYVPDNRQNRPATLNRVVNVA